MFDQDCLHWTGRRCAQDLPAHRIVRIGVVLERFLAVSDKDPARVNFVDLREMVMALPGFDDDPKRSGEKILEAIQSAWMEEAE